MFKTTSINAPSFNGFFKKSKKADPKEITSPQEDTESTATKKGGSKFRKRLTKALIPLVCLGAADLTTRCNAIDYYNLENQELLIDANDDAFKVIDLSPEMDTALQTMGSQGKRFLKSLAINKPELMEDLNLTEKQYDDLVDVALKISKNETQFGESMKYRSYMVAESYTVGAYVASKIRDFSNDDPTLSRGMTQYKIDFSTDEEKALFDKYGVTYDNLSTNIQYPEKSAIATMIHLGTLQKGYNNYLESMNMIAPDMSDADVQKSVENARSIVFNDSLRPKALKALTRENGSKEEAECLASADLTQKDLEDLRTFAKGIVLSEKAYVAAGWPGKNIYPYGKTPDIGCANLLNAAAGVGYIANITKDVQLP